MSLNRRATRCGNHRQLFFALGIGIALGCSLVFGAPAYSQSTGSANERDRELIVLNWSDYLHPDLVLEFEEAYQANVKEVFFSHDKARDRILLQNDGKGFDLIMIDGATVGKYRQRGWLRPITPSDVPNLQHIDRKWIEAYAGTDGYVVPYFWGTVGIGYRKDLVSNEIASWMDLFEPNEELHGKIIMLMDPHETVGVALLSLGYSPNSSKLNEINEAEARLRKQKPFVNTYGYMSLSEQSELISGEILAAMMFSGDALKLRDIDPRIAFVVPKEGTTLWADYWAVSASSNEPDLAYEFINFLNEPKIAARSAEFVFYAPPNIAAQEYLPSSFMEDPIINPPSDVIARSEFTGSLSPRTHRRFATILANVMQ